VIMSDGIITSKQNKNVKLMKSLHQKKNREKQGLFPIEGIKSVAEALDSAIEVRFGLYSEKCLNHEKGIELVKRLIQQDVSLCQVSESILKDTVGTETPQGIIVAGTVPDYSFSDISDKGNEIVLVVDGVQDPGNLGTIIRTACAAGVKAVFLLKGTVDAYSPKVVRATMGALFHIPLIDKYSDNEVLAFLKGNGYQVFVAHISGSEIYYKVDIKRPVAWVLGNEGNGPGDFWIDNADQTVQIPLEGKAESLNVSVAAGILLFDTLRRDYC
jgi:TrmH family RNA methyltransferase